MSKTGIALFVYNRPYHTSQVLAGLKKNNIKKLYIFADGLKNKNHEASFKDVRLLINHIDWCETELILSPINKGLSKSIIDGVNYIFKKYEQVIVLEDDCVPSDDFIRFMERCFHQYKKNPNIMCISGDTHLIKFPIDYSFDIYFGFRISSWGWGTWKRSWLLFNNDLKILSELKKNRILYDKVKKAGEDLILVLELQQRGLTDSWAVFWALTIILNNGFCINPVYPKIKNIGMDGSGTHCGRTKWLITNENHKISDDFKFPKEVIINNEIIEKCSHFYQLNWIGHVKRLLIKIDPSGYLFKLIRNIIRRF